MESEKKLSGFDRKVEILNAISERSRTFSEREQIIIASGIGVERVVSEEEYNELVDLGTPQQEFNAALAGLTISIPE